MNPDLSSKCRWILRYVAAVAAVGVGLLVRLGLTALVGESLPTYITFYPVIMAVALLGGFGPGLVATLATALAVDYWLLPPVHEFGIARPVDAVGLAFFTGMGVFMSVVAELYRRARQRAAGQDTDLLRREGREPPRQPLGETVLLAGGLFLALAILCAVGWQTYRNLAAMVQAEGLVGHAYIVDGQLEQLFATLQELEASERGYLIMGEEDYLRPYNTAKQSVAGQLASIKRLTGDNPSQVQRLEGIEALVDAKLAELKEVIEVRRSQGPEAAHTFMAKSKGQTVTEEIRQRLTEAEEEEHRLLDLRTAARDADRRKTLQALLAGSVLSFLLLTTVFVFLTQENSRRRRAEAALRRHEAALHKTVAARTADLSLANETLSQQREWLRITLSSIGDAVLATDIAGHITFLNPVAETLTGWQEEEVLGQPVQTVFQVINEETRAPGEDIVARVLREGRVIALANHTALVTRDGHEVPIEDSAAPIKDSAGTVSGVVLVFHEVTEKRRAQAALREFQRQNEMLASVIESSSQAFGMGYPDGRLGLFNRAFEQLTGYSAEELRTMDWTNTLTPPEWRELERQKLEELHATGQPVRYEKEYIQKDGTRVPIELLVHLARDGDGKPEYYYSFLTDITERKLAVAAVLRLNSELRQRVADLQAANDEVQASRRAALSLAEDAIEAGKAAEEASAKLRESQERLKAFADASFEGIVVTDQGRVVDCNEQTARMVGYPREELIGSTIAKYMLPEDLEAALHRIQGGKETIVEHQLVRQDGSCITVEAHGRPSHIAGSTLRYTAMRDITSRKQREQLLEKLVRALKALKDSSQAMMRATSEAEYLSEVCRIMIEDCGHAMVWVGLAEEDESKTVRRVASAGFEEGYLETLNITWADTDRGRGPTGTAIRTGKPCSCGNMLTDPAFTPWRAEARKRGYASSLAVPLLAGGKAFGAFTLYARQPDFFSEDEVNLLTQLADDVSYCIRTLRLRAAKIAADVERDKFVSLAENSTEFIAMCDMNLVLFYVNDAGRRLVGLDSLAQACRTPVSEFFFPEDRQFIQEEFIPRVLRDGRAEVEVRFRHFKTGAALWIIYTVFYVKDAEGRPVALATVSRDITDRKRAQAALQHTAEDLKRSNRDLEQFAYVASHDLQEPLRAVGGYVKLLQHRFPEKLDAKAQGYIAGAFEGATRMERLISDLLAFSRVGTRGGNFVPVDLDAVLNQALGNLQTAIKAARATITHDRLPTLSANATQMMQLFQNLIGNALKFKGEAPPSIHVGAQRQQGRWLFSVRDNGIGIEPQYFKKIFLVFQRLHTRKDYAGTGIGLAICKKIVERHAGTIWAESQPGQGSTFYFTIPEAAAR